MPNWDILILDKSASMTSNKISLVNGFNELITEQKSEKSDNFFTVITFNDEVELYKEDKIKNFTLMKNTDIITRGTTALYDAIGYAYNMILQKIDYNKITITIITDGLENDSKYYTVEDLNNMKKIIENKYTVKLVFIGTDISCITNNCIEGHATHSVDCKGDLKDALKIASRTMSSHREGSNYIPQGVVTSTATPLVMKRSKTYEQKPPNIKKCKSFCNF